VGDAAKKKGKNSFILAGGPFSDDDMTKRYAKGGGVTGGIPGVDSVPIMAQGGEYVLPPAVVQAIQTGQPPPQGNEPFVELFRNWKPQTPEGQRYQQELGAALASQSSPTPGYQKGGGVPKSIERPKDYGLLPGQIQERKNRLFKGQGYGPEGGPGIHWTELQKVLNAGPVLSYTDAPMEFPERAIPPMLRRINTPGYQKGGGVPKSIERPRDYGLLPGQIQERKNRIFKGQGYGPEGGSGIHWTQLQKIFKDGDVPEEAIPPMLRRINNPNFRMRVQKFSPYPATREQAWSPYPQGIPGKW